MRHDSVETRYVTVDHGDVAYKVVGEGPLDLLHFYGIGSQIDSLWEEPSVRRFLDRLAAFSRVIVFDRRGTGASDRLPGDALPTWEDWTQDVSATTSSRGYPTGGTSSRCVTGRWIRFPGPQVCRDRPEVPGRVVQMTGSS
jgi:hypothetical protein